MCNGTHDFHIIKVVYKNDYNDYKVIINYITNIFKKRHYKNCNVFEIDIYMSKKILQVHKYAWVYMKYRIQKLLQLV